MILIFWGGETQTCVFYDRAEALRLPDRDLEGVAAGGGLAPDSRTDSSFRAARVAAALSSTRLRPSSITAGYHFRLYSLHQEAHDMVLIFHACHIGVTNAKNEASNLGRSKRQFVERTRLPWL